MSFETIVYQTGDSIARITLNRPERRNALSWQLRRELVDALRMAERDDDVSVVLVDANGPAFCSGYDIATDASGSAGEPPHGWVDSEHFNSWTDQFARSCMRDWLTIWDLLKRVACRRPFRKGAGLEVMVGGGRTHLRARGREIVVGGRCPDA